MAHPDYEKLLDAYPIARIAGEGSELERAMRLMDEYAPRLKEKYLADFLYIMKNMVLMQVRLTQTVGEGEDSHFLYPEWMEEREGMVFISPAAFEAAPV